MDFSKFAPVAWAINGRGPCWRVEDGLKMKTTSGIGSATY